VPERGEGKKGPQQVEGKKVSGLTDKELIPAMVSQGKWGREWGDGSDGDEGSGRRDEKKRKREPPFDEWEAGQKSG